MSNITYWQNTYKECTPDSVSRAYNAMIKEHGKADTITMDHFVRAKKLGGLGFGRLKKDYYICGRCGMLTNHKSKNGVCSSCI